MTRSRPGSDPHEALATPARADTGSGSGERGSDAVAGGRSGAAKAEPTTIADPATVADAVADGEREASMAMTAATVDDDGTRRHGVVGFERESFGEQTATACSTAKRCYACKRKIKLVSSIECRCGRRTCFAHRLPEEHACPLAEERRVEQLAALRNRLVPAVAAKVAPM